MGTVILIGVGVLVVYGFLKGFMTEKKHEELSNNSSPNKLSTFINILNKEEYNGEAKVTMIDTGGFKLYKMDSNQIIYFTYNNTGLTVIWKCKYYYEREVVHQKTYNHLKVGETIADEEQVRMAKQFLSEIDAKMDTVMRNVISNMVVPIHLQSSEVKIFIEENSHENNPVIIFNEHNNLAEYNRIAWLSYEKAQILYEMLKEENLLEYDVEKCESYSKTILL